MDMMENKENEKDQLQKAWVVVVCFSLLFALFVLSSCKTQKCVPETIEVEKIVEYHHRDTTIVTDADSASAVALLECDSNYNVILSDLAIANGDRINLAAQLKRMQGGSAQLEVNCNEDSLQHRIDWLEKKLSEKKTETLIKEVEVEKEVIHNSPFAKFCIWHTIIVWIILLAAFAIWLVKKIYLKR